MTAPMMAAATGGRDVFFYAQTGNGTLTLFSSSSGRGFRQKTTSFPGTNTDISQLRPAVFNGNAHFVNSAGVLQRTNNFLSYSTFGTTWPNSTSFQLVTETGLAFTNGTDLGVIGGARSGADDNFYLWQTTDTDTTPTWSASSNLGISSPTYGAGTVGNDYAVQTLANGSNRYWIAADISAMTAVRYQDNNLTVSGGFLDYSPSEGRFYTPGYYIAETAINTLVSYTEPSVSETTLGLAYSSDLGRYVAITKNGNTLKAYYGSTLGTWSACTVPSVSSSTLSDFASIVERNGKFEIGYDGGALVSEDGITFTAATFNASVPSNSGQLFINPLL